MMVFSGLLKPSAPGSRRLHLHGLHSTTASNSSQQSSRSSALTGNDLISPYIRDECNLVPVAPEGPDLRDLNNSLIALATIFPDVQVEVFREMLSSFDPNSRLEVITESLLKHKLKWVQGRYRVTDSGLAPPVTAPIPTVVAPEEKFRSSEYKTAVKTVMYQEFKGLSRSTINAVLAEFNHSYALSRPTLIILSSKSWRFSISSLFLRRKPVASTDSQNHPLITWQTTGRGSIIPAIKTTGSAELDRELFEILIAPLKLHMKSEIYDKDHALAVELANKDAQEHGSLFDCECCFTSTNFENLSACNADGHFICFECVRHCVNEAIFGQGWQRTIDSDHSTIKCMAAIPGECQGCIPYHFIRRAFDEVKGGREVTSKFDERLIEESLFKSDLPLIRCPFCVYAEVDHLYLPENQRAWRLKGISPFNVYNPLVLLIAIGTTPLLLPLALLLAVSLLFSAPSLRDSTMASINASFIRLCRKRRGLKFTCQNLQCGRSSCMSCAKAWTDIHICHESSLVALRTQVEQAMSLAIKRTCPRCSMSFVKSSGCNKLTCVCGYQMCYVCRKDIGNGEGYRHFCEHFRPTAGATCTECTKCDLYRCENEESVVKKAKEQAERQWMEKEGMGLGDDKIRKELEAKLETSGAHWTRASRWLQKIPTRENVVDAFVDTFVE